MSQRKSVFSTVGRQDSLSMKYDVSDLIFKRNCAKHFGKQSDKENYSAKEHLLEYGTGIAKPSSTLVATESTPVSEALTAPVNKNHQSDQSLQLLPSSATKEPESSPSLTQKKETSIILAVDAVPTRGGGLLRLSGSERSIFYYSASWASMFEFEDSTKFEMVNTALALQLFEPYIKAYRNRYDKFIVKTDSHFFESLHGFKDPNDIAFLLEVRNKVEALQGQFQHAFLAQKDPDIQNADYLSRATIPLGLKVNYNNEDADCQTNGESNAQYAFINLSSVASTHSLEKLCKTVPEKYLRSDWW